MRLKLHISGIVQGVGFRPFIYRTAVENRLTGYVRNRGDAGVEILLEGSERAIQNFMRNLKEKKPPLARIYHIETLTLHGKNEYDKFTIQKSINQKELSGSVIPPDVSICQDCLTELRNPTDPRHGYFFITCTNCGPRFTTIQKPPYDRDNTTMHEFPMCPFCQSQYKNPTNRRFHAQTVACPKCGPQVYLTNNRGELLEEKDPVQEAGRLLSEGSILAIKGYGGFHVATSTTKPKPLARLRQVKHRKQKPFAIMARSLEATRTFAEVNEEQTELLSSYARPIVLLNKSSDYHLSDLVAPGLHNVGVMLPYTGLHDMLFDEVKDSSFVMTSANPPNQPIINDNDEALRTLRSTVDYFLFHNRQIAHRCDDSVVRTHHSNPVFLRRSRGYAPAPITLSWKTRHCTLGLGGELNNTACVLNGNKAFISQHIGDVENVETRVFLESATKHLIRLTNSRVEAVACDLHPKFTSTNLAHKLAEENAWKLTQVQHHHAHVAALMAEHDLKEIIGVCCDGYGYGSDGEAWGGEILLCTREASSFRRVAHLQKQPLVGGDLATLYPLRMAAGILRNKVNINDWLLERKRCFPHGEKEVEVILTQFENNADFTETTSCGRVLDAVSAVLEVCYERTYEGEPSMKLESAAMKGRDVLNLKPVIRGDTLDTEHLLTEIFKSKKTHPVPDLAYSAHTYMAKGLAELAVEKARQYGVRTVGFTGGVACNEILTLNMQKIVEAADLEFVVHNAVPPGDGGLSIGQAVASSLLHT